MSLLWALLPARALGQSRAGSVAGQITDATGGAVIGADVTLRLADAGATRAGTTDARGRYLFDNVPAGRYELSVTHRGFLRQVVQVTLLDGQSRTQDLVLTVAPIADAVRVTFTAPQSETALKYPAVISDQPRAVTSYTADFIRAVNARRVEDLLPYITGVTRAGDTAFDFTIRGVRAREPNNILIDGLPGLPARFGSPPLADVERIEVLRGPASTAYGAIQPGGMINIVTKKPTAERQARVDFRVGSLASPLPGVQAVRQLDAEVSGRVSPSARLLYRVTFSYDQNDSFRNAVEEKNIVIAPAVIWARSPQSSLEVGVYLRRERGRYDDGLVAPANDINRVADFATRYQEPGDFVREDGVAFHARYSQALTPRVTWTSKWRAVFHDDYRHGYENFQIARDLVTLQRRDREQKTDRQYNFVESNLQAALRTGRLQHQLLLGAAGGYELRAPNQMTFTSSATLNVSLYEPRYGAPRPAAVPGMFRRTEFLSGAVYVQDHVALTDTVKALVAIRADGLRGDFKDMRSPAARTTRPSAWSPSAGLVFTPDRHWSVYSNVSTSFAPANPEAQDAAGHNNFGPERGRQLELGARVAAGGVEGTVAAFSIVRDNVLTSIGGGVTTQTTEERSKGLEGEFRAHVGAIESIVGYAYTDAEISEDAVAINIGARVPNVARHSANVWGRYVLDRTPLSGLGIALGVIYRGDRAGSAPSATAAALRLPAYTRADAMLSYRWGRYDVLLQATNLTNRRYFDSALSALSIQPGAPRRVVLSLRAAFGTAGSAP